MQLLNILRNDKNKFWLFFIVLCGLTLLMIYSFMPLDKINPGHDILFHYRRFNALMDSLNDGNFPIYMDFKAFDNYGYGARWFYPDLILIPFAIIANITSFVFAYKMMWFVMTILCGLFTYKMVNEIYNNTTAACLAALLYTFSTYRLQDVYERGAVGEAMSFTFIPIVFWGLYEIIKGDYKKWYIISIGFALLIYTHLLSSTLTFITSLIFVFICYKEFYKQPKRLLYLLLAGFVTIFLCSYFLVPFIEQMLNQEFTISTMKYHAGTDSTIGRVVRTLFYPHTILAKDGFIPQIGIVLIACLLLRFFIKEKSKKRRSIDIGVAIGIVYIVLALMPSWWNNYPLKLINFIQYPWRFYEFSTLFFSIAGGYYLSKIIDKKNKPIILFILIIAVISGLIITNSFRYKVVRYYYTSIVGEPIMTMKNYFYFFVSLEYFPQNLSIKTINQKGQKISSNNSVTNLSNIERKDGYISCNITTNTNDVIEFPLTFYKGYTATLDNKEIEVKESKRGLVEVPINRSGNLIVQFTGTFLQKYSLYLSLITFIILLIYINRYNKTLKKEK